MGPSIFKRRLLGGYDQYSPSFWEWPCASPSEINFDLAIDIGDFGHGSDSPIILDYQRDRISPCVKYLRWNWVDRQQPPDNHWIEVAPTFAIFAERIGLMTA